MAHSIKQNKLTGTMPMKLQTSDFLDKNFKGLPKNTQNAKENMNKRKKGVRKTNYRGRQTNSGAENDKN